MKNTKKNYFNYIIIIAVMIIPFMYSYFYLKAYWNPYGKGNIDNLPVAVVNLDEGNKGKELIKGIKEKDTLKLKSTTASKAEEGLYDKTYYAVITIPKDFTSSMESISTENKKHPTITYSPNQKSNYLASQIIDKVITTVEKNLDNTINSEIVETLSTNLEEVPEELDQLTTGFSALSQGTNQLASGSTSLVQGTNTLNSSYQQFDSGLENIKEGSSTITSSMATFNEKFSYLASNVADLSSVKEKIPTLIGGVNTITTNMNTLQNGLTTYVDTTNSTLDATTTLAEALVKMYDENNLEHDETYNLAQSMLTKDTTTNLSKVELLKYQGQQIKQSYANLNQATSQLNNQTQNLSGLTTKLDQLTSGINQLEQGSQQITMGMNQLDNGINTLFINSSKIKSGISTLSTGANTLSIGTHTLNNSVNTSKQELTTKVNATKTEVNKVKDLSNYANSPIKVKTKEVNKISSYGTAFSPFFISIALWVGCLMMYIVLYYDKEKRFKKLSIDNKNHLQRTVLYHVLATSTAIILGILLQLLLDLEITNVALYYVSLILIANTFIAIMEFLIVNFKDVGKFIALILLVLQLAASGGTFPIETVTSSFRWLNPWLPMTYTINLLKESLVTIEANILTANITVILLILVVMITINLIQDIRFKKKNS